DPIKNSSQSPPHIDHHYCYGSGDSLNGIFCQLCACESCGNGAHIGYNCPSKVPIISNTKPYENSFAYDSTPNFVDDSHNVFNPPTQPPMDSYEFCGNDAHYSHNCPPQELAEYINTLSWNRPAFYNYVDDDDEDYTIAITIVLSTEEPVDSLTMEDEHLDTIPATESNEVIKSSVENLVLISSESEGIPNNMCDVPFRDNSLALDISKDQFEDFSDSNDEFTLIDDDYFSIDDIDYVEASPPDYELVSLEEVKDDIHPDELLNIHLLIAKIESLNDNPTPNHVLKYPSPIPIPIEDSDSYFKEFDTSLSYSDNSLPEFETFSDHTEETSSGSTTTHADYSLLEYDSFIFEIELDQGQLTSVIMEDNLGEPHVHVPNVLPTNPTLMMDSDFIPSDDSLRSDLEVSFPSGTRNKIFDSRIFEVQPKSFLSQDIFYISFIRDPLCPVIETLLQFSSENEDQLFNPVASRRHVPASYWTAASDVAATSAPATVGQRQSTPLATGQRRRITVVIGGQRWQSTPPTTSQRWRSTTVAGGEPPLTAAGPPLTTTGPPVNGGWWAGQRAGLGRSGSGLGRVRIGSGSGLGRVQ
nr:hypothetical protein [Tanacetum cinerariifolium]